MIKFELNPSPLAHPTHVNVETDSTRRLLVLLPTDADYSAATRRIWELANATSMQVRLLALCQDPTEEQGIQRQLVTMASLLQNGNIYVETRIVGGTNWVPAVKNLYAEGDVIVCFAEHRTGLLQRPLSQILESSIQATIYVLSAPGSQKNKSNNYWQSISWLGFVAIILGFGILQTNILQLPGTSLQSILLILSILPEFWLIWVWNSLIG
jgi:hypothetical protein